jgi:deoxyribonuclease V
VCVQELSQKGLASTRHSLTVDLDFARAVKECVDEIPPGQVSTCGAIARALGDVRASRSVATWLAEHPETPNGHRVVRADGRPVLSDQEDRLANDGVIVRNGRIDGSRIHGALRPLGFFDRLREEQIHLAANVVESDETEPIVRVAGVDVAYRGDDSFAAAVSIQVDRLEPMEIAMARGRVPFPYVPTYLAYREFPAIEAVVSKLAQRPEVLMIDGHGRLHPSLFGAACYAGVRLDMRTIGIAKHLLVGRSRPADREGAAERIEIDGETRGYAWRPPGRTRPIYVSVGHRFSLEGALKLVRQVTRNSYPEPLRIADRLSKEMKENEKRERGATR